VGALGELPELHARLSRALARAGGLLAGVLLAAALLAPGVAGDPGAIHEEGIPGEPATAWSAPVILGGCPGGEPPWVVFPSEGPSRPTGPGALVSAGGRGCPAGEGALVSAIGPEGRPGAPAPPRTAGGQELSLGGPLTVAGGPHGQTVISAARAPAGAGARGVFTEGAAGGPFAPAQGTGGPASPVGLASAYLGDVAIVSSSNDPAHRRNVRLRVERHMARAFGRPLRVSRPGPGPVQAERVALDYRSDALVVWWQRGAIYAREEPASGRHHASERLAAAAPHPRIAALISDDNRAIVAWADQGARETSVYLDLSAAGVRFHRPMLLERFANPAGLPSPTDSPSLIRLSSESVMIAWNGSQVGHWVIRTAPIDLNGLRTVSTIPTPNLDALLGALAPGPAGEALVLWTEPQRTAQGIDNPASQAIFAARGIDASAGLSIFGAPEQVAPPGPNSAPTVAIDPGSDRALAAWRGAGGQIDYSIRSPAAP
jgi:hypothetical protein